MEEHATQFSELLKKGSDPIERQKMKKNEIIKMCFSSISHMLDYRKSYHSNLPPEILDWHCYLLDAGHSILSILKVHADECFASGGNPFNNLVPVPVKTVLRGFIIIEGFVVVDVEYSELFGAMTPEEDDEY